jgi:putative transposase
VWEIKKKYEEWGFDGLKDHQPGRLFQPLSSNFYNLVIQEWKNTKYGARKLKAHFDRKGHGVSLRKIQQVLVKEGFQKPNLKKQKPRKYKRYEWPIPNIMWHTDWHIIKNGKHKGLGIIVFIDDCSRKIMSFSIQKKLTAKNSVFAFYLAIWNNKVSPYMLNSDRGSHFIPARYDKEGLENHLFQAALAEMGVEFIPSRARHPQTNGKNEKWFDIFEKECDERFETISNFVDYYNGERISEALDYLTPNEAYKKRL